LRIGVPLRHPLRIPFAGANRIPPQGFGHQHLLQTLSRCQHGPTSSQLLRKFPRPIKHRRTKLGVVPIGFGLGTRRQGLLLQRAGTAL
jgi:hypothetical protein